MAVKIKFIYLSFIIVLIQTGARPLDTSRISEYCHQIDQSTLSMILGPAFNPRYMSIQKPSPTSKTSGTKREYFEDSFFLDNTYQHKISNQPAWEVDHTKISTSFELDRFQRSTGDIDLSSNTQKELRSTTSVRDPRRAFIDKIVPTRDNVFKGRPWECEAKIKWIDLGFEYFPRYLRSVDCTRKDCWYGHYICKPKSFTVKVLHRHTGECTKINRKLKIFASFNKGAGDFTELWTWEEKAINFCCDCVAA